MWWKKEKIANKFQFIFYPNGGNVQEEIQSLWNFSFLKIVKIEPTNKVQFFFSEWIPWVPIKLQFSYLSLY